MKHIFISDLHLAPHRPALTALFQAFLAQHSGPQFCIYILGDLFDLWLGDDYSSQFYQAEKEGLLAAQRQGTQLFFMPGNRDFLVGETFAASAGLCLLKDPTLITLQNEPIILCHGDQLCTDDVSYQAMRTAFQNAAWIKEFLSKPIEQRLQFAKQVREESYKQSQLKSAEIMDANPLTVERFMAEQGVLRMIHGHTHRPRVHQHHVAGRTAQRWVLGDWHDDHAQYVFADDTTIELRTFQANQRQQ